MVDARLLQAPASARGPAAVTRHTFEVGDVMEVHGLVRVRGRSQHPSLLAQVTQGDSVTPKPFPGQQAQTAGPTSPSHALNPPGNWDIFIGHSRRCADAIVLATEIASEYQKRGLTVWLDVKMKDRSIAAMKEGVQNSKGMVAVVTGPCVNNDFPEDDTTSNAYFRRVLRLPAVLVHTMSSRTYFRRSRVFQA